MRPAYCPWESISA